MTKNVINAGFANILIAVVAPLFIAIGVLMSWQFGGKAAEDMALDKNTKSVFLKYQEKNVHCSTNLVIDLCFDDYKGDIRNSYSIINFGNSQQHAINQYELGDETASKIIHRELRGDRVWITTYSQPNVNLQEHYFIYKLIEAKYKPKAIILPVFFDDLRETGIRTSLLDALVVENNVDLLMNDEYGKKLLRRYGEKNKNPKDLSGLDQTLQQRVEAYLDGYLADSFEIWAKRPQIRSDLFSFLYQARNFVFQIDPSSVRREIPINKYDNIEALSSLLKDAQSRNINVFLYIPPIRNDRPIPYNLNDYMQFKINISSLAGRYSANFRDFDALIPGQLWGTPDINTGEVDYMHFRGPGHKILADSIIKWLHEDLRAQ